MAPLIGYYAHHHGSGHLTRAGLVAEAYPGPVHVLGSAADARVDVALPSDLPADVDGWAPVDPDAGGTLHWAPRHARALAERAAVLVDWVRTARPVLVVVDVSVEVAVQLRLLGVPVVVVRQHGERTDAAHRSAYAMADALLAPYPAWAEDPTATPAMRRRTRYAGGFSRFDGRPAPDADRDPDEVVVLAGTGGTELTPDAVARLAAGGSRRWTVLGVDGPDRPRVELLGRVDDPWPHLCRAGVVVASAGHSALCEAAAAGAPTVAVAEPRPFDEQEHKVAVLAAAGAVHRAPPLDEPAAWEAVLDRAAGGTPGWRDFVDGAGATRAAEHLVALARSLAAPPQASPAPEVPAPRRRLGAVAS